MLFIKSISYSWKGVLSDIKLIVNYYRAYICHQPKVVGRWQNIGPRRSRGPIFVTCPQLRAGGKNICPVIINNKRYCQFNHYYISYSAFFLQVYSDFKLAAEYENIRPQLAAEYFHIVRNLRPNISISSRNKLAISFHLLNFSKQVRKRTYQLTYKKFGIF